MALNKQRSIEEKTGKVRWLRPDYQIPRFGSDAEKARLEEDAAARKKRRTGLQRSKARFSGGRFAGDEATVPTGKGLEETIVVMRLLEAAKEPVSIEQIARHFAQGKQIEKRVGLVMSALARLGHVCFG